MARSCLCFLLQRHAMIRLMSSRESVMASHVAKDVSVKGSLAWKSLRVGGRPCRGQVGFECGA